MAKKTNNPDGKKGGQKHRNLQISVLADLKKEIKQESYPNDRLMIKKEVSIDIYDGKKTSRVADVAAYLYKSFQNTFTVVWLRIVQIGKTDKEGNPVARELEAIKDMEQETGIKVEFYDYETNKKIRWWENRSISSWRRRIGPK